MGENPWDSKEGAYDKPSSDVPKLKETPPAEKKPGKVKVAPIGESAQTKRDRANPMLAAALGYAARGWPVFPCSPQTKSPLLAADRDAQGNKIRGTGGVSKATCDADQIRGWWLKWPKAMIGLATGRNGLFVVDFDPRTDEATGEDYTLERLKGELEVQMGCPLPGSLAVRTQSGGVHVYLRQPDDGGDAIRNRGNLPLHVDVRGHGGYVIAPPSVMTSGREYRWLHGAADVEPVEAPAALIEILRSPKAGAAKQDNVGAQAPASSPSPLPRADDAEDEAVRRYAQAALEGEVAKARDAVPGTRNATISGCGLTLGHFVAAGALSKDHVIEALAAVAREWPNLDKTMDSIVSAVDRGMESPRDLSAVRAKARDAADRARRWAEGGGRHPSGLPPADDRADGDRSQPFRSGSDGDGGAAGGESGRDDLGVVEGQADKPKTSSERVKALRALHARLARYNRTDLGNAERFRDRFGDDFRFSPALGWFQWDKRRWRLLTAEAGKIPGEVLACVFKMVRSIRREAWVVRASGDFDAEKNPGGLDRTVYDERGKPKRLSAALLAWAETSEGNARLMCVAGLVRPWLTIEPGDFDKDLFAFNVMNGTLKFRRVRGDDGKWKVNFQLCKHDRRDMLTKLSPVTFDRYAECRVYDGLLEWAQPDESMRRYLHQWGGLSLTGETGEQVLHFWHGGGGNGKGTVIDAWCHVAGDYFDSVGIGTFLNQGTEKSGDKATPDLAKLPGVRLLRVSEPKQQAQLAEELIKLVTGQDPIDARHLNKGFFKYLPHFKLTILGNHWLGIKGTDRGIWRRVKLIPWLSSIADADKDTTLPDQLKGEASGILNRMLLGLLDWMRNGLIEPKAVTEATAAYREASDPLGRFLKLCTKPSPGRKVQSSHLFAVFVAWCAAAGEKEWTNKGFSQALMDKGFKKKASDGMQWLDIELTRSKDDFVDEAGKVRPFTLPDDADADRTSDERPPGPPPAALSGDDDEALIF